MLVKKTPGLRGSIARRLAVGHAEAVGDQLSDRYLPGGERPELVPVSQYRFPTRFQRPVERGPEPIQGTHPGAVRGDGGRCDGDGDLR